MSEARVAARIAAWANGRPTIIRLRVPCALVDGEHDVDIVLADYQIQRIVACPTREASAAERLGGKTCHRRVAEIRRSLTLGTSLVPATTTAHSQAVRNADSVWRKVQDRVIQRRRRRLVVEAPVYYNKTEWRLASLRETFGSWMSRLSGQNVKVVKDDRLMEAGGSACLVIDDGKAIYVYRLPTDQEPRRQWAHFGEPIESVEEMLLVLPHRWICAVSFGVFMPPDKPGARGEACIVRSGRPVPHLPWRGRPRV